MTRYHANPKTGETSECRAKVKCRFGYPLETHPTTRQEAAKAWMEKAGLSVLPQVTRNVHGVAIVFPQDERQEKYRINHQAPVDNGYNAPMHDLLGSMYPEDVQEHPEWYGQEHRGTLVQLRKVWTSSNPGEEMVTIYRGVPKGIKEFHHGDWVALSRDYAQEAALGTGPEGEDGTVIMTRVPAKALYSEGNSLEEWGLDASKLDTFQHPSA